MRGPRSSCALHPAEEVERLLEEVHADDPELAKLLRVEDRTRRLSGRQPTELAPRSPEGAGADRRGRRGREPLPAPVGS
jgi:hypothetical protein